MKFSILIAHYNNVEYFKNCFESIKKQSYENWEQVLFDTLTRRNIKVLYKKDIKEIENLPQFIFNNQYTLGYRIKKKIGLILEKLL